MQRWLWSLIFFGLLIPIRPAFSQGTLHRESDEQNPDGYNRKRAGNLPEATQRIRGAISLADGGVPEEMVQINGVCLNVQRLLAVADAKGRFSFSFDANRESDRELTKACTVAASLEGYETQTVNVAGFAGKSGGNLGTLVLKPMAASTTGLSSSSDAQVTAGQRKALQKSIDKAAKQDWDGAIKDLQQLTSAAPAYASAWLTLGMCLQIRGDREQAENSFLRAIRADPKFAPPLIRVATIEAAKGELQAAITHSQLAIEINPRAFPDAYWVNAVAEITLGNVDAAEKSARQGLAIDPSHHFPELDYTLGMVLYTKDERPEARKELRAYLDEAPGGPNAAGARNDLAAMDRADHAEPTSSGAQFAEAKPSAEERGAATGSQVSSALPANGSLEEHNAPLLKNGSSYTCLETATPVKIDARGRPVTSDTVRLDVGVSEGKEIYGIAAGKLFFER